MAHQQIFKVILFSGFCCFHLLSPGQKPLAAGEHFATVNGLQIHYYVSGKGPVCLFPSPGTGPSVDIYKNTMLPLEKFFTMVYYDTRMSGKSTGPDDPTKYSRQHFVDDMDALRIYLQQPKVWLMGHSAGGYQIVGYGIQHSDKLYGIISLEASVCRDSLFGQVQRQSLIRRMENVKKSKGQAYFERYYGKAEKIILGKDTAKYTLAQRLEMGFPFFFHDEEKMKNFPRAELGETISEKASSYTQSSKFADEDICSQANRISVPTLVVAGDDYTDKVTQVDNLAKNIPSSTVIIIKNAGHFPWIEQPTQFFSAIIKWLKQHNVKENK